MKLQITQKLKVFFLLQSSVDIMIREGQTKLKVKLQASKLHLLMRVASYPGFLREDTLSRKKESTKNRVQEVAGCSGQGSCI